MGFFGVECTTRPSAYHARRVCVSLRLVLCFPPVTLSDNPALCYRLLLNKSLSLCLSRRHLSFPPRPSTSLHRARPLASSCVRLGLPPSVSEISATSADDHIMRVCLCCLFVHESKVRCVADEVKWVLAAESFNQPADRAALRRRRRTQRESETCFICLLFASLKGNQFGQGV